MTIARLLVGARANRPQRLDGGRDADAPEFSAVKIAAARTLLQFMFRVPAHALLLLIRIYQHTLSPVLPVIFGSACGCRFSPTCSHYAAEAIRTHGTMVGVVLAAMRLVKCTPLHPGGFDPVPPRRSKPRCARIAA